MISCTIRGAHNKGDLPWRSFLQLIFSNRYKLIILSVACGPSQNVIAWIWKWDSMFEFPVLLDQKKKERLSGVFVLWNLTKHLDGLMQKVVKWYSISMLHILIEEPAENQKTVSPKLFFSHICEITSLGLKLNLLECLLVSHFPL